MKLKEEKKKKAEARAIAQEATNKRKRESRAEKKAADQERKAEEQSTKVGEKPTRPQPHQKVSNHCWDRVGNTSFTCHQLDPDNLFFLYVIVCLIVSCFVFSAN